MTRGFIILLFTTLTTLFVSGANPGAPGTSLLRAEADPTGILKAIIYITAPNNTLEGDLLADITKVELRRDGNIVKVFDSIHPGSEISYIDTSLTNGFVTYSAVAYNEEGAGTETTERIFVGVDTPLPPGQVRVATKEDKISFTWAKSENKGVNGELVIQDALTYRLEMLDNSYYPQQTLISTQGLSYDLFCPVDEGKQNIRRFGLRASNITGWSDYKYIKVITGAPYYFPYRESFSGGTASGLSWQEGDGDFIMVTDESADNDAGALMCIPAELDRTSFNMGKICMSNTLNPRLTFMLKGLEKDEKMILRVARRDGAEASLLTVEGPVDSWTLYKVDLSLLKKELFIIPKFILESGNTGTVYIDDIRFEDPYTTDLGVRLEAPETSFGSTQVTVHVTNEGIEKSGRAYVKIFTDGILTSSHTVEEILEPGETSSFETTVEIQGDESVDITAHIYWEYDVNPENDVASVQIIPVPETQPAAFIRELPDTEVAGKAYSPDGKVILFDATHPLPSGIYIINGRKTVFK